MKYLDLKNFFRFLDNATSPFQVIRQSMERLEARGFERLYFDRPWDLKKGGAYFLNLYDTTVFAFRIGKEINEDTMLRMAAAHTDFPSFRIKPNAVMKEKSYIRLNTEAYGGMILSSWYDRALSISGKVALKSNKPFEPREILVDLQEPVLVIPNLAIHLNREVNSGVAINKQTDVLPLLGLSEEEDKNYFNELLAGHLNVPIEDILDYDLFIYNLDKASTVGKKQEFICSPRLDDLSSAYALLQGIAGEVCEKDIHIIGLYDNEEIGNRTKQGCETHFTGVLLEKIYEALGMSRIQLYETMMKSFILSADVAQAFHPNYPSKFDPTNRAELGKGIVIKINTAQKYAYDTGAIAILQQLCEANDVKYQKFVNHSDAVGGGTMGPVLSSLLPMKTVDIGVPLLAMHSAVETMGVEDQESIIKLMISYFATERT